MFKLINLCLIVFVCCFKLAFAQEPVHQNYIAQANYTNQKKCSYNESRSKPDWVNKAPSDPKNYYGVGYAEFSDSFHSQMKVAEINARNELAMQIQVQIKTNNKIVQDYNTFDKSGNKTHGNKEQYSFISEQLAHAVMYGSEIVDRWVDESNCLIYVLSKIKKGYGESLLETK